MDKSLDDDVRRGGGGTSRFSSRQINDNNKQSVQKKQLFSGGGVDLVVCLEKPKKQRLVKKLSAVNRASSSNEEDSEMGCCNLSGRESEFASQSHSVISSNGTTAKRFKLSKKFSDDCNGVDHASIPRKLRSAMKKRYRESLSPPLPDSKKLNHTIGVESSLKKDGLKKSKLSTKQGSSEWSTGHAAGPITKDEEEVVETLYALAGMFPDNDSIDKRKLESTASEASLDCKESPTPGIEDPAVTKEDGSSTCPLRISESTTPSSNLEKSVKETARVESCIDPSTQEQPDSNDSENMNVKLESCEPQVNLHNRISLLSKPENKDDEPACDPVKLHFMPELDLDSGLKQSSHKDSSVLDRKPEFLLGGTDIGGHLVQQDMVVGPRTKGPGLWPGLSPMVLHDAGSHGPLQSSAAKIPAWLDAAICASRPCSLENGLSLGKASKGSSDRKSRKRCAAHVYISRLIQNMQMPECKEKLPLQSNPLRTLHDIQKQGSVIAINDFDRVKKGLNGVIPCNNIASSTTGRNFSEARNGFLHQNRLQEDHQQNAVASRVNTLQKQGFDFLYLSAGSEEAEATKSFNRSGNHGIAPPSSQFQVPYLHSLSQHQRFMPLPMPQTRYHPSAYPDQLSASTSAFSEQVQLQSPYLSSPFLGPHHTSSTLTTKQQQQQQQLWAAQLTAQYRHAATSTVMNQIPSRVNGRQDPTLLHCPQSAMAPSPISQLQQQQSQLATLPSSFPPARVKRQDHHLPLVYEEVEGGFRASGAFPLQLLCNERL